MKAGHSIFVFLLLLVPLYLKGQTNQLLECDRDFDLSLIHTAQANVALSEEGGLNIETSGTDPLVEIHAPGEHWDLYGNTRFSMLVNNTGNTRIRLSCHLNDHQWNQGMIILKPGENRLMKTWVKGYTLPGDHLVKRKCSHKRNHTE